LFSAFSILALRAAGCEISGVPDFDYVQVILVTFVAE
jgi:hypothetical protein